MVAITGNVPGALIGKDAFQEIDITGITLPMTKHNYLVRERRRHPARRRRGVPPRPLRPAGSRPRRHHEGRPAAGDARRAPLPRRRRRRPARLPPHPRRPPQAAQARRPGDRRGAAPADPGRPRRPDRGRRGDELRAFAEKTSIPVAWTLLGIGAHRRAPSAGLRLHGHARLEARQPRDPVGRPADRGRHALRRPGHRQRPDVRAVRADHPRRHRPGRDRQERRGRGADRRRREARPRRRSRRWCRRRPPPTAQAYFDAARRVEARVAGQLVARLRAPGATACCPPTSSSSGSASSPGHEANYVADVGQNQMWLARYTGFQRPNSHLSARAASGRWATASRRRWARRSGGPSSRPGRSPATAASR